MNKENQPVYSLYFIRHGRSLGNELHLMSGWRDVPLTDEGREQIQSLKARVDYPQTDLYYHSGLCRATETMRIIYPEQAESFREDWRFAESFFGLLEGTKEDGDFINVFFHAYYNCEDQGFGEELFDAVQKRVKEACHDALDTLREKGLRSAAIGTHYGGIKAAIAIFEDYDLDTLFDVHIPNGSLWRFDFHEENGKWIYDQYTGPPADVFPETIVPRDPDGKLKLC